MRTRLALLSARDCVARGVTLSDKRERERERGKNALTLAVCHSARSVDFRGRASERAACGLSNVA